MPRAPIRTSLARVFKVFVALTKSKNGLTFAQLQDAADVSRRTLYRYLNTIEDCGIRITLSMDDRGRFTRRIDHYSHIA